MTNGNDAAFSRPGFYQDDAIHDFGESGLTKREYFAAMAMQGILANTTYEAPRRNKLGGMAQDAVNAADALIAALNQEAK